LQHSGKFKRRLNFRELQSDYESSASSTEEVDERKYIKKKIEDVKKPSSQIADPKEEPVFKYDEEEGKEATQPSDPNKGP